MSGKRDLKEKRSFTLSRENVAFLEARRKQRRAASVSAVLEKILDAARAEQQKASLDQAITRYYSNLTVGEAEEQAAWGDFSTREFSKREHD